MTSRWASRRGRRRRRTERRQGGSTQSSLKGWRVPSTISILTMTTIAVSALHLVRLITLAAALSFDRSHCRSASSPWRSNGHARRATGGFEVPHLYSLQCCLIVTLRPYLFCTLHAHLSALHGSYKPVQHSCLWFKHATSRSRLPGATSVPAASDRGGDQLGDSCLCKG